jgi:hypothetical protein
VVRPEGDVATGFDVRSWIDQSGRTDGALADGLGESDAA